MVVKAEGETNEKMNIKDGKVRREQFNFATHVFDFYMVLNSLIVVQVLVKANRLPGI